MIDFKFLNMEALEKFINSKEFITLKTLPITKHRAISHIQNPRTDKDDVLLILAYEALDIVGYLGVLPDRLFESEVESIRCGWLSCFWVDANKRGSGIGEQLIRKSLELWDHKILSAEFVPFTKVVYDRTGAFNSPIIKNGIKLYARMDLHTILPPKKTIFQKLKPLLIGADAVMNAVLDLRFMLYKNEPSTKFELINSLDEETIIFISKFENDQLFKRGVNELNWILKYPWILSSQANDLDSNRYYFSSIDKSFICYCLKVRNERGELVAFLMFTKRNNTLKLPYCYMEKTAVQKVIKIIESYMLKWRINAFITFHPQLVEHLSAHKTIGIYKKKIERQYLVSNELHKIFEGNINTIQDGDGDCVFT